ncbi:MAG: hypothetical protein ABMA64_21490 [Myxococcota bacterium]
MIPVIRHLVAAFVAFHLFAVTFCALPSVGSGMNRSAWRQPTVQGEFRAWNDRLRAFGWTGTQAELEDHLWAFASGYESARAVVMRPLAPYLDTFGTWQSWKMFVAPHRFPARVEIHVDRGAGWEPVYVARSSTHDWLAGYFDHDRFRAALFRYGWEHYRNTRKEFATWVAGRAADAFPDAHRVRVSFVRYRTRSPEEVRAGTPVEEKRELEQVRDLDTLRAEDRR